MNELDGYDTEDLKVGMSASFAKTISEADIVLSSAASGDTTRCTSMKRTRRPRPSRGE